MTKLCLQNVQSLGRAPNTSVKREGSSETRFISSTKSQQPSRWRAQGVPEQEGKGILPLPDFGGERQAHVSGASSTDIGPDVGGGVAAETTT